MKVLILGVRRMSFQGSQGFVDITKVSYLDKQMSDRETKGFLPLTVSADASVFSDFLNPGVYEVDFYQKPDSKGRPVLTMTSARFIKAVGLPMDFASVEPDKAGGK